MCMCRKYWLDLLGLQTKYLSGEQVPLNSYRHGGDCEDGWWRHTFIVHVVQHVAAVPAELPGAAAPPQQLHPRPHPHPHLPPSTAVRSGRDAPHQPIIRVCQIKHIAVPGTCSTVWDKYRLGNYRYPIILNTNGICFWPSFHWSLFNLYKFIYILVYWINSHIPCLVISSYM